MFPKSKEGTVSIISEQLGAYREIKEDVYKRQEDMAVQEAITFLVENAVEK